MGDHNVRAVSDPESRHRFSKALLEDIEALERMLRSGQLEKGVTRIGFEQELFLTDAAGRPAPCAPAVLATLNDAHFTTEIARFNLELNVPPLALQAGALHALDAFLHEALARARQAAAQHGADLVLAGILPSITLSDLTNASLSPAERYHTLDRLFVSLAGGEIRTVIQGEEELQIALKTIMLEACNTSVQVHLQVDPARLATVYDIAQLVSGPVLAAAANAPLLLQRRLWHETRIPAFEQSVDFRRSTDRARGSWSRVHFGDRWLGESVLDVYRDQVARHEVLLVSDTAESSLDVLARGDVPALRALSLHNGSLYRWNRLCYGVTAGVPHLRIEHRPLPSGPTVRDEIANAALWLGLVLGIEDAIGDVRTRFPFADARANFHAAAHHGLDAQMRWDGGQRVSARMLLTDSLLPLARAGLAHAGLPTEEISTYLDVIAERVACGQTGAVWMRDAWDALTRIGNPVARSQAVTRAMRQRQWGGAPVAQWSPIARDEASDWPRHVQQVQELMSTDVFTVHPEDLLDVAAHVMEWKHIRHVPVQDGDGALVGLISHRTLLLHLAGAARRAVGGGNRSVAVREVMETAVHTVAPTASCAEALALLRTHRIGCLPVVLDGRLLGIVSERDFLPFAGQWFAERG